MIKANQLNLLCNDDIIEWGDIVQTDGGHFIPVYNRDYIGKTVKENLNKKIIYVEIVIAVWRPNVC